MDKAMELANAICANAQIAVCESKRCIRMGMQTDIHTGSAFEAEPSALPAAPRTRTRAWARSWRSGLRSTSRTGKRYI